jgi:hypothetical protein
MKTRGSKYKGARLRKRAFYHSVSLFLHRSIRWLDTEDLNAELYD